MTVAGHHQTNHEERRARASHLIEQTKAFRQQEFSSSPGKAEKATWRDSTAKRTPQYNLRHEMITLLMRILCVRWVLVNAHWQQMPACMPHPLTPFKQIIISRDVPLIEWQVPMIRIRLPFTFQIWQIRNHADVQLQRHQKLICNGKIYDLHLPWRTLQLSFNRHSSVRVDACVWDGLQMMSGPMHGITADFWQIAVFDFIGVWPWNWCGIP